MADADVDALAREIFDWYLEHEPVFATHMGIHEYDHLMPDGRLKAKLDEIKAGKAFKKKADAISPKGLSIARTIDLAALRNTINLSLFEEEELRFWESMPGAPSTVAALCSRSSCGTSHRFPSGSTRSRSVSSGRRSTWIRRRSGSRSP